MASSSKEKDSEVHSVDSPCSTLRRACTAMPLFSTSTVDRLGCMSCPAGVWRAHSKLQLLILASPPPVLAAKVMFPMQRLSGSSAGLKAML